MITHVDGNSDFFSLGGHSIAAALLATRLSEDPNVPADKVDISVVSENPSVLKLAAALHRNP